MAEKSDKAPQAAPGAAGAEPKADMRRFKMHSKSGKKIGGKLRTAGAIFLCDAAEAAKHPELTEVDAAGKPMPSDKIAARETGAATGFQKRG